MCKSLQVPEFFGNTILPAHAISYTCEYQSCDQLVSSPAICCVVFTHFLSPQLFNPVLTIMPLKRTQTKTPQPTTQSSGGTSEFHNCTPIKNFQLNEFYVSAHLFSLQIFTQRRYSYALADFFKISYCGCPAPTRPLGFLIFSTSH